MTPPNRPRTRTGRNWIAATNPSQIGSWVSSRIEPRLGERLHPGPDQRDELAEPEEAEVAVAEGAPPVEGTASGVVVIDNRDGPAIRSPRTNS